MTLLSLSAAAPAMAYSGGAPSHDLGCTFHKNGLYDSASYNDYGFEYGFMVWGSSSASLVDDNDNHVVQRHQHLRPGPERDVDLGELHDHRIGLPYGDAELRPHRRFRQRPSAR